MSTSGRIVCCFLLFFSTAVHLRAADAVAAQIRQEYENKIALLRGFYQDSSLHLDPDGQLIGKGHSGSWTTSFLYIKNVWVNNGNVQFDGKRVAQISKEGVFKPMATEENLTVRVDVTGSSMDEIRAALSKVFVGPKERLSTLAPPYWKEFLEKYEETGKLPSAPDPSKIPAGCPDAASVDNPCKVGGAIKPPKPLSTPDPHYEPLAQKNKYQGTSVLWLVIDENGQPQRIKIVRAQGFGLDEKAVEAVSGWRFKPATREGKAIPVQIDVEVNFRLY